MSANWITDRKPTKSDAGYCEHVWITTFEGTVLCIWYAIVDKGIPWMPIEQPEPYVNPKRYVAEMHGKQWGVKRKSDIGQYKVESFHAMNLPTRDAAERIAAIYEEVMP